MNEWNKPCYYWLFDYYVGMFDEMILKMILLGYNEFIIHCTSNYHNTGRKKSYKVYFGILFY